MAYLLAFLLTAPINWGAIIFFPPTIPPDAITIENVIELTNDDRVLNGLSPLTENLFLDQLAQNKVADMSINQSFSHIDSKGNHTFAYDDVFTYQGENLAVLYTSVTEEENAFMNSPEHRDNILNKNYQAIGVATIDGQYAGKDTTYVAVEFGG